MTKLWVGGATGFLGSHLVRALLDNGDEVVAVSRGGGVVHGVPVASLDVCDAEAVKQSALGATAAFLATGKVSRNPAEAGELHRLHVVGTREALRGLRQAGVRRVVYASTSGTIAVGTDPHAVYDEGDPTPLDIIATLPYYRTKHYAELEALEANDPPHFEVVIVNPSLLLGPGDERGSSTEDVRRFLERSIPAVPAGGLSFADVRDVASAMVAALERGRAGERYLLSAQNLTVAAFLSKLERLTGVPAPRLQLPKNRALSAAAHGIFSSAVRALGGQPPVDAVTARMGQYFWYCNPAKAERELGFSPRDPAVTLRDTVRDLLDRGIAVPRDVDLGVASSESL